MPWTWSIFIFLRRPPYVRGVRLSDASITFHTFFHPCVVYVCIGEKALEGSEKSFNGEMSENITHIKKLCM